MSNADSPTIPSPLSRVRDLWNVTEVAVEELVVAAEAVYGPGTGADKKQFVTEKVMDLLRQLEKKYNFLPGAIEGIAFTAIGYLISFTIERVLVKLKITSKAPKAPTA